MKFPPFCLNGAGSKNGGWDYIGQPYVSQRETHVRRVSSRGFSEVSRGVIGSIDGTGRDRLVE